jgi:hypothetical protein
MLPFLQEGKTISAVSTIRVSFPRDSDFVMYIRFADLLTKGFLSYCEWGYLSYANINTFIWFLIYPETQKLSPGDNFTIYSQIALFNI